MNEKWFKLVITLIWSVATACFILVGYAAYVSATTPLFLKIPTIGLLTAEEIQVTLIWVDGLGG